jgi:DNA processing protein
MSHHRAPRLLRPDDAEYPARLHALPKPPLNLTIAGDAPRTGSCAVAVVGTREPTREAETFAFDLAGSLVRAGAVVVSGGAVGIDAAAHRGALASRGTTWAIAASGLHHCFPKEHADLYREISAGPGAVLWPFADDVPPLQANFLRRNGVLVALADAVVIVQAGAPSGTLNAASWAQRLGRTVWAVPGPPWDPRFTGCRSVIDAGARVLTSIDGLLHALGLQKDQLPLPLSSAPSPPSPPPRSSSLADPTAKALFAACAGEPQHVDKIAENAGLCVIEAQRRLLTLALENVLVEGPEGFYRRAK